MAYVKAFRDPFYILTPQSRIAVLIDEIEGVQEKQFGTLLVEQLQTDGFNIVPESNSEFTLIYGFEENSSGAAIWINAYRTADLGGDDSKIIWRGYLTVGAADFQKDQAAVVRTLLAHFGQEFMGAVPLARKP